MDAIVENGDNTFDFTYYDSKYGPSAGPTPNQSLLDMLTKYGVARVRVLSGTSGYFDGEEITISRAVFVKTG